MSRPIEKSRNSCALHGALQTLQAIEGFAPIIHSTSGCGLQQYYGGNRLSGNSGSGYIGGLAAPSSNIIERQIIFGGSSRLREQIKNTLKVIQADYYLVLTGCATELVGDDIPAMTKEVQEQEFPIGYVNTPGFLGDVHHGYELVVKGLIEQLAKFIEEPGKKISGLVNILGIVPNQDVFWYGHLAELKKVLEAIGLQVNTLFGPGQGIEAWKQIPRAELNLVFSPWGVEIAKHLEGKYQTPYLQFNSLPVGTEHTNQLLREVGEKLNVDSEIIEQVQKAKENEFTYFLEKIADAYYEYNLQKEFALVGEAGFAVGVSKFLIQSFGLIPKTIVITDNPPESYHQAYIEEIHNVTPFVKPQIVFDEDAGRIHDLLRDSGAELVLGSSLEKEVANELNVPLQQVSFPITDKIVLGKSYIGYEGAIALLEDLSSSILSWHLEKRRSHAGAY